MSQRGRDDQVRWNQRAVTPFIFTTALLFLIGLSLMALGVWYDLPGLLGAYGDPEATWPILVEVVLGAAAFGTWRWVNRRKSRPFAVVLFGLGILTVVVLASASYAACPDVGLSQVWSVVTRVVGLVTNNYDVAQFASTTGCRLGNPPLALQFARLAQLMVLLVAATGAVIALLPGQVARVATRSARRIWLVVGVDDTASVMLPALTAGAGGGTLAVITTDPFASWLGQARAAGWRVIIGDPHDVPLLRRMLVRGQRRALRGLAVLAADSLETQRLVTAVEHAVEGSTSREPVRALLRIDDPWQAEDWRRRYLGRTARWIVDTISENEVTARLLVEDALVRGADRLLITGHSDLTFAIVAELAQQARERAVIGDTRPMPVVVLVGPTAHEAEEEHRLSQERFGNQVRLEMTIESAARLVDVIERELAVVGALAVLFTEAKSADQRLAARLGATYPGLFVYTRRAEVTGLGAEPLLAQVRAFGMTLDAGSGGRPVDRWERIARLAHEHYLAGHSDSRLPAWDSGLPRFYRESNVRAVLRTLISAVEVGRSWGASKLPAGAVSLDQLESMAQLEHESWIQFYGRHKWTYAATRDDVRRHHPYLLPWGDLPEEGRERARDLVRSMLALLETLGYRSFDDPKKQWQRYRRIGEVTAVRHQEPWTWFTVDGDEMRGESGDWQVTDEAGTRSIKPHIFAATHEHVGGDRYRRTGEVEARPAVQGEVVQSPEGTATARKGQYVMKGDTGEQWLVPASHVGRGYEPL